METETERYRQTSNARYSQHFELWQYDRTSGEYFGCAFAEYETRAKAEALKPSYSHRNVRADVVQVTQCDGEVVEAWNLDLDCKAE